MNTDYDVSLSQKIVLGTVQFGLSYGIANSRGQPDVGLVREILDRAYSAGIRILDTAAAYGQSEAVLGACSTDRWEIITKIPSLAECDDARVGQLARESVMRSLELLRTNKLHAVLVHDVRDLTGARGRKIREALRGLLAEGLIGKLGASVYDPADLYGLEESGIVQAPFNVLDQRMGTDVTRAELCRLGADLHVRSVFLQGLLLMKTAARPSRFAQWAPVLTRLDEQITRSGVSAAAFCLGFVAQHISVSRVVVGVDCVEQLEDLVSALAIGQETVIEARDLAFDDPELIDPRKWKNNP
ncbi:aldo/keto reductase [Pseudogemmobacter faecipullorum]|uniref:Aldo/keto reductase n=1 Tax=Pseudogemmobacter faecipullorum TaxID=2755041 RepID=A0ABS8CS16_9RHOB|nr:aldo/keto reductase [Pseudogemmobacter faecipullorum]MCB5411973.1 aldo/keto reductase [Pseudogemmobacter faecipullorum]